MWTSVASAVAFAMQEEGLALMRENLRRRNPNETERELDGLTDPRSVIVPWSPRQSEEGDRLPASST